jgi:hypothetical protein
MAAGITFPKTFECNLGGTKRTTNMISFKQEANAVIAYLTLDTLNSKNAPIKLKCPEVVSGQEFPVSCFYKDQSELVIVEQKIGDFFYKKAYYKKMPLGDCHNYTKPVVH